MSRHLKSSFRDASIAKAALQGRASLLYTEDLQDGQVTGGLAIVNPFRRGAVGSGQALRWPWTERATAHPTFKVIRAFSHNLQLLRASPKWITTYDSVLILREITTLTNQTHQPLESLRSIGPDDLVLPPNRSFGLLFCLVFAIVATWPLLFSGSVRLWAVVASGLFGAVSLIAPDILTSLNRTWMKFGALLHRIVSPIVLGVLFFAVITPFGLVMRLFGRNLLGLRREATDSYWVNREPPGPKPDSLTNQF